MKKLFIKLSIKSYIYCKLWLSFFNELFDTFSFCSVRQDDFHCCRIFFDIVFFQKFNIDSIFSRRINREEFFVLHGGIRNDDLTLVRTFVEQFLWCWFSDCSEKKVGHVIGFGGVRHQWTPVNFRHLLKNNKVFLKKLIKV